MSLNTTLEETSQLLIQKQLYPDIDLSTLSKIEQLYASWYIWIGNPAIATALLGFIIHETMYFGRCIPWLIIDAIPYFRRWKLQPTKISTPQEQWECMKELLLSHFFIQLPLIFLLHPVAQVLDMQTHEVPFPPLTRMAPQIAVFFVLEDIYYYFAHQLLHKPPFYRYIHKLHHKYSAPFGMMAEYAHPAEVIILGMGTVAGPQLYCYFSRDVHVVTVYVWIVLRILQAIDAHSGYDFPWSLHHFLPFWSGAEHHDFHHMSFTNNFSTSFRWCDWFFGTDIKYREYRAQRKAALRAMEGMGKQEQAEAERKFLEQVEREGELAEALAEGKKPKTE